MILGLGADGIMSSEALNVKDLTGQFSAAQLNEEGRIAMGITERFPLTWEAARKAFANNAISEKILGKQAKTRYLAVNQMLAEALNSENGTEEVVTKLVKYF